MQRTKDTGAQENINVFFCCSPPTRERSLSVHLKLDILARLADQQKPRGRGNGTGMSNFNAGTENLKPGPHDWTASTFIQWAISLVPPAEYINPVKDKRDSKNKNVLKTGSLEKTIFHSGEKSRSCDMKSKSKRSQPSQSEGSVNK